MQLTLTPSVAPSIGPLAGPPSRGRASPWHDTAALQLDRLAAAQRPAGGAGMGASAALLAIVGGLLMLGLAALWLSPVSTTKPLPPAGLAAAVVAAPVQQAPPPPQPPAVSTAPGADGSVLPEGPLPLAPLLLTPLTLPAAMAEGVAAAGQAEAEEARRQARARQVAQARRQAAQAATERAAADEAQRLQRAQRREQELAQQRAAELARERAAAAEPADPRQAASALNSRRSVSERCASAGGFIGRQFCHARECRSAEHEDDAVCVRLREIETARASAMR